MKLRPSYIGLIIGGAALLGLAVFGILAAGVTTVTRLDRDTALDQFEAVVDSLDLGPPRLTRDGAGRFANRTPAAASEAVAPTNLGVMVYGADHRRLIRTDIPFWFFRLKGPVVQLALKDSGFDLKGLGITPADIARQGAGLILDESFDNGDRLLVWAE